MADDNRAHEVQLVLDSSHNLRTSLTILKGYLSLAEAGEATLSPTTAHKLSLEVDKLVLGVDFMLTFIKGSERVYQTIMNMTGILASMEEERIAIGVHNQELVSLIKEVSAARKILSVGFADRLGDVGKANGEA